MPVKKAAFKQFVRTFSKTHVVDEQRGLDHIETVTKEVSDLVADGWQVITINILNNNAPYGGHQDAGVEVFYALQKLS